jgi:nucleotide-binding universal stress UspA family protein
MYKRMLVPLDGSKLAEVALPYAEELAGRLGYEVTLVNVRSPAEDPYHPVLRSYLQSMAEKTKRNIQASLVENKRKATEVEPAVVGSGILVGHPAEGILDYADKEDVDLIVMATHGRTGIKRWALGSIADKVVRAATHPVLLVRANINIHKEVSLGNILVPLDGSKQSETVLPYIENLASKLKSNVILLHVIEQPYHVYAGTEGVVEVPYTKEELKVKKEDAENYLERVGEALAGKDVKASNLVEVGKPAEEIVKLAQEPDIDIVAMSTYGRSGFSRWEHGSVADKILRVGNTPLLLIREPARKQQGEVQKTATELETVNSLIGNLASDDGVVRVKARKSLVTMGKQAVAPVIEALKSKKHWVRWEATKTLAQLGDPTATQALVNALEDEEFDVRWLAAEGLIHLGDKAIGILLKALTDRPDSAWLREGAHHVLHDLPEANFKQSIKPVLEALEDVQPSLEVAPAAEAALDIISQGHSQLD